MQLLSTLSHMPFMVGTDLLFCHSDGEEIFSVERTETAVDLGVPVQSVNFQPWRLARLSGGSIETLDMPGMSAQSPVRVFCNPIVHNGILSFVHGRAVYACSYESGLGFHPAMVKEKVFAGFYRDGEVVHVVHTAPGPQSQIAIGSGGIIDFPFSQIVRIAPIGPDDLIVTGTIIGGGFRSVLWSPINPLQKITVNGGEDVYKCCIESGNVIYAKKNLAGETFLHIDPVELTPYP